MEKSEIIEILHDWNFWKKDIDAGIERKTYLKRLKELAKMKEIVVVSGVRRSGKSTLLLQFCKSLISGGVRKEDILIVNFEDPRFKELNLKLLNNIYEIYLTELAPGIEHYVVLDEVQVVDGWEKFARYLRENKKVNVFVTGSTSKLLSSEYSSVLAGRHVDMEVYPLSFSEFLFFKGVQVSNKLDIAANRHRIKRAFLEYIRWGGFPKVCLIDKEKDKKELLNTYFRDIIIKDVVSRYKIRESNKLEELAKYYLSNISSIQSFNRIKNILKLSLESVERFSAYLANAYFLSFVRKFGYSVNEQILNPRKVYCVDVGMRNSMGFVFSSDFGRLAEDIVFLELKKSGKEVFYWKSERQEEVDFLLKKGNKIELIQVCWNPEKTKTKERELFVLLKAMKEFKLRTALVFTEDYEAEEKIENKLIKYIPIWKWLLSDARSA